MFPQFKSQMLLNYKFNGCLISLWVNCTLNPPCIRHKNPLNMQIFALGKTKTPTFGCTPLGRCYQMHYPFRCQLGVEFSFSKFLWRPSLVLARGKFHVAQFTAKTTSQTVWRTIRSTSNFLRNRSQVS